MTPTRSTTPIIKIQCLKNWMTGLVPLVLVFLPLTAVEAVEVET
jgi:hypothetical protein